MNTHLSDDQLHDYAGRELAPGEREAAAAHLEGCADCRERLEPLLALTARLAALPRAASTEADGWCALHARLAVLEAAEAPAVPPAAVFSLDAHRRRRAFPAWVPQAAAAALLVGVGFGGGRLSAAPGGDAVLTAADTVATAMQAAARVQRAGTEYVAAVAHLVVAARLDTLAASRGRDATIAACHDAARELTRLRGDDSAAVRLFRAVSA
jgi:anti-sigma factor RsiW